MVIVGFTFLRNAIHYDYPFRESIRSLAGISDAIVVAVGNSHDDTLAQLGALSGELACPLHIVETTWDESLRESGTVLSQETNIALARARELFPKGWAFYLQGDEVLDERDYGKIRADLSAAEGARADAVRFRYLHFWLSPDKIAVGKRWYPQEIRAIRLDSSWESYGDAQSFRNSREKTAVRESDAHIFHYGHVREADAYARKKRDFHRWWHADRDIPQILAVSEENDAAEKCLRYLGPHPIAMRERLKRFKVGAIRPDKKIFVLGNPQQYSQEFLKNLALPASAWLSDYKKIIPLAREECVLLETAPWLFHLRTGFRFRSQVPQKMDSREARPFTKEFRALLLFSERNIDCSGCTSHSPMLG